MRPFIVCLILSSVLSFSPRPLWGRGAGGEGEKAAPALEVGFGEVDISPKIGDAPVYMAGFGQNRKATRVHDPLFARAVVLKDGTRKIALVSVDLVGFFLPNVVNVRKQLSGFDQVTVSSTHTH